MNTNNKIFGRPLVFRLLVCLMVVSWAVALIYGAPLSLAVADIFAILVFQYIVGEIMAEGLRKQMDKKWAYVLASVMFCAIPYAFVWFVLAESALRILLPMSTTLAGAVAMMVLLGPIWSTRIFMLHPEWLPESSAA